MSRMSKLAVVAIFGLSAAGGSMAKDVASVGESTESSAVTVEASQAGLLVWYRFPNSRWSVLGPMSLREAYAVADNLAARGAQVNIVPQHY